MTVVNAEPPFGPLPTQSPSLKEPDMPPSPLRPSSLLACAATLACSLSAAHAQSITNLGVLQPDHHFSMGTAVSANGNAVAGASSVQFFDQTRAFLWTQSTGAQDIGAAPDAVNTFAQAINADGSAIAGAYYSANRDHAFRWTSSGGVQDLGALENAPFGASATAISADGNTVAGSSSSPDGDRAFRWTESSGMQSLGTLPGGTFSWGLAMSADGAAVTGIADTPEAEHAFLWSVASGMQTLPTLNAEPAGGLAINADASVVAGYIGLFASRWVDGSPEILGTTPGGSFSTAYSISGNGQFIGGVSDDADGAPIAFLWSSSLGMVDLNTYLPSIGVDLSDWTLTTTTGISFDGRVLTGTGTFDGEERGWVVTIPTPSSASLLALGGLLAARRRR